MQTQLGHILFSVRPTNMRFYRDLLTFLGWNSLYDSAEMLGVSCAGGQSLWFGGLTKDVGNDYDGPGMNHLAIATESPADVDAVAGYLRERNVALLFETPRHRPEFAQSEAQTYYQVMFESPDRILLEVVYTGPKAPIPATS
jgi:catechol 2,3-dioxygenase-like lactoylglutathione lyase family enzyme